MQAFDDRLVKVGIEIDGQFTYFEGLDIRARGRKFTSSIPAQCELTISNLTRDQRNEILTKATPLIVKGRTRTPVKTTLEVGRKSYGTFLLYEGNSFACGATQPPDIGITLQSITNNLEAALVGGFSQSGPRSLRIICQSVADSFSPPLSLDFQAKDKTIANFSFTGAVATLIEKLNRMGNIQAFIDNGVLVVIDSDKARDGVTRKIDMSSGMVGVPQVSDIGVTVKMMIDNSIELGGSVQIESKINPAVNGTYKVVQIYFDIANRQEPFYYTLFCSNLVYIQGTV